MSAAVLKRRSIAVVGLGTFGAMRVNANAPEKAAAPLPEVDVATVVPQTVTDWQSYSGRLEAVEKVDVRPQVSGTIVAVNFKDGALVKKGDVLFVIDPRPYQADTDRAAAQLAAAQARDGYAQSDWQRAQRLIGDNAIAKIMAAGWDKVHFAWAGGLEKGQGHYYRIQGPTFLVEYDNTQNNANHIHTAWRDFNGDFGRDVLGQHLAREHAN